MSSTITRPTIELTNICHDISHSDYALTGTPLNYGIGLPGEDTEETNRIEIEQTTLPQVDGGKSAYLFLGGCFMAEAMCWALPLSYGIFQDYYSKTEPFSSAPNGIAIVGTCATGILYLGASLVYAAIHRWPSFQNYSAALGIAIMSLSLLLASFANSVWQLILTQGVLFGIGGCLLVYTAVHFLDGWFVKRKGLAYGVLCTGNGVAGATVPFILNWSLATYSFRTTLRIWSITVLVLTLPFLPFLRPRIPISKTASSRYPSYRFLFTRSFWLYQTANILQGLGYFIPTIYLSVYAQHINLPESIGSLLIALINIASVFSQLTLGYLVDHLPVSTVMLISALGSSFSAFLFWGTATSLPLLIVFALMYGAFAGGFTSTFIGMTKETIKHTTSADSGTVFGLFCMGKGIGSVVSGPLSEALLAMNGGSKNGNGWFANANLGYGTGYGSLIVFTGISALCGGLSFAVKKWKML